MGQGGQRAGWRIAAPSQRTRQSQGLACGLFIGLAVMSGLNVKETAALDRKGIETASLRLGAPASHPVWRGHGSPSDRGPAWRREAGSSDRSVDRRGPIRLVRLDGNTRKGYLRLEGIGRPGQRVHVQLNGRRMGLALVGKHGHWRLESRPGLSPGHHTIDLMAAAASHRGANLSGQPTLGDEEQALELADTARIWIPARKGMRLSIRFPTPLPPAPLRRWRLAALVADAETQRFAIPLTRMPRDPMRLAQTSRGPAPRSDAEASSRETTSTASGALKWLKDAHRTYQGEIVPRLSDAQGRFSSVGRQIRDAPKRFWHWLTRSGVAYRSEIVPRLTGARQPGGISGPPVKRADDDGGAGPSLAKRRRLEQQRRAEATRQAEADRRKAEIERRAAEEARRRAEQDAARDADEQRRIAETDRLEAERRRAEAARQTAEVRREAERLAEEARRMAQQQLRAAQQREQAVERAAQRAAAEARAERERRETAREREIRGREARERAVRERERQERETRMAELRERLQADREVREAEERRKAEQARRERVRQDLDARARAEAAAGRRQAEAEARSKQAAARALVAREDALRKLQAEAEKRRGAQERGRSERDRALRARRADDDRRDAERAAAEERRATEIARRIAGGSCAKTRR